jgi:hypothetical protein
MIGVKNIRKMIYRNLDNWRIGMMMGLTTLSDRITISLFKSHQFSLIPVKNIKSISHNTK